jgi:DNA-binding SARP family transcriptional activator
VIREIDLMGGFAVRVDGDHIPDRGWTRRRAAELVKVLALEKPRRLHRDQVLEAPWPHLSPEAASASLRKAVHFARRALGSSTAIVTRGEMVELWPG